MVKVCLSAKRDVTQEYPMAEGAFVKKIEDLLDENAQLLTGRATVQPLEEILYHPFPLLDHGFVRVVDYMGDDNAIVQAARVSYGRGTKKSTQDKALIAYLMRHRHTTPFEMCEIKFHVKMPIFVARQWLRHRTASVNEYSARYSILSKEFYVPSLEHLAPQSSINNQGREGALSSAEAARVLDILRSDAQSAYAHYEEMMNAREDGSVIDENRAGIARELARMNLSLNFYTEFYWKIDLHNLLHFISLRADSHAQYEIRVYAEEMARIVEKWTPFAHEAFTNYRINATTLSGGAWQVIQRMLRGETVSQEDSGLGAREWRELMEQIEK